MRVIPATSELLTGRWCCGYATQMALNNDLKKYRVQEGLSCREVARRAGVSTTTVTRIESGTLDPTAKMLERLLVVFGKLVVIEPDRTHAGMPKKLIDVLSRRGAITNICERYGVARLEVFGSVARGSNAATSDIDLLYTMKPGAALGYEFERMNEEFAEILNSKVDLVSREFVHPVMRKEVYAEAHLLYEA